MQRMVIARMDMCNLALHRLHNIGLRNVIRDKDPIGVFFQIRLLEFNEVRVPLYEGVDCFSEFLYPLH